jgi:transposase
MTIDSQQKNEVISRWKNGQSLRGIARDMALGRHGISRVIAEHLAQTGASPPDASAATKKLLRIPRRTKLDRFLGELHHLLERYPHLTAQRAWEELRALGYTGSYSTVRSYLKASRPKTKSPTVRFETAPGVQAQMDWSTYTIDFQQEGRRRVELFSYILGYSRRQYVSFTERQDFETTVRQHIAAFEHLGGVAAVCLYDNMKVVVTRWEDGQPIYNTRFLSFATHYGFRPWACQPERPETKGKVERPFDYVEKNLLNGRTFRSLEHLNEVTRWWLAEVNDRRIHGTTKRPPLELHAQETSHLIPLPTLRFDTHQVVYRIVDSEGLIRYADNRYSVPWRLIGQTLPVRITEDQLQIYNASIELIAEHTLLHGRHEKQTQETHRPPKDHAQQLLLLREKYAPWGPIGQEYFDGLQKKCRNGKHEAARMLSLLRGYPVKDGQVAMARGIQYHAYGYQSLERILAQCGTPKANWERLSQREQEALQQLTESTRVDVRRSTEYQHLFDEQSKAKDDECQDDDSSEEPPRSDPPVSGDPETEDDGGAA